MPDLLIQSGTTLLVLSPLAILAAVKPYVLIFLGFSAVIFVHELGHFLVAKWADVRIEKFCIGFGRELIGFTRGETRYGFNILPLGGYVKMLGQEDFVVDKSGELKVKDNPDSFISKSIGQRMVIISAGVVMNLLFAAVAFAIVVMVGRMESPPIIGLVREDMAAGRAGLQVGDRIRAVNGDTIRNFTDLTMAIVLSDPNEELVLDVERDGKLVSPKPRVLPEFRKDEEVRQIGIASGMNLRVARPTLGVAEEYLPGELQAKDELRRLASAERGQEFNGVGPFLRAVIAQRGAPLEVIVKRPRDPEALKDEMCLEADPDIETTEVSVQIQAKWVPVAYEPGETVSGSLLGLVPRMTVIPLKLQESFEKAGVEPGDVITSIGGIAHPNHAELKEVISTHPDQEVSIEVRRTRAANHDLAARTVEFCVRHRETLIQAALEDVGTAPEAARRLIDGSDLPGEEQAKLLAKLNDLESGSAWRRWLERVDIHRLEPIIPQSPFALFKNPPPRLDTSIYCLDEDHLVVADVKGRLGQRISPAQAAGIPRGAVILSAAGRPVRQWYELSEVFRTHAGQVIDLTFRVADDLQAAKIAIPDCISAALDLAPSDRIVRIAGQDSFPIADDDGLVSNIALPDWRAVRGLLSESIGRTVSIEYTTTDSEKRIGEYAVTAGNIDPWLHRVRFLPTFTCYPLLERNPIRNPFLAVGVGFEQAYRATMHTIQTIRHMIFTKKVGVSKISGPVGIFRIGSQVAGSGIINLLWFLAVISANLAVINFLPIPIVDGGLFLFLLMEKARGEPVSIKTQVATQLIGIALIATVFLLVTYQDIKNWILGT
jgi:membrane-associated protease RseP (regulator of RpoE activity)